MANEIIKIEEKWMWIDDEGVQVSPVHHTLDVAIKFKVNWKPWNNDHRDKYRKDHGSKKKPHSLVKIVIEYRAVDSEEARAISKAFESSE